MVAHQDITPVVISSLDFSDLQFALCIAQDRRDPRAELLERKLDMARICHPNRLPDDVVALDRDVVFQIEGEAESRQGFLLIPNGEAYREGEISALEPIGAAILGLTVGQRISYDRPSRTIMVQQVSLSAKGRRNFRFCHLQRRG